MARWGYCFLHGDASCLGTTWGQPCRLLDATGSSQICGVINSRVSPWSAEYPWFSIRFMLDSVTLMEIDMVMFLRYLKSMFDIKTYCCIFSWNCFYMLDWWFSNLVNKRLGHQWEISQICQSFKTYFTRHIEIILERYSILYTL